jgi:phage gpG-like protein
MMVAEFDARSLQDALCAAVESVRSRLDVRIRQKLSGEILQARFGAIAASVSSSVDQKDAETSITYSSTNLPYAEIQEFGGKTAAHEILAQRARALAFAASSDQIFARRVQHPGSVVPSRSYFRSSLTESQDELISNLKQAILNALMQD